MATVRSRLAPSLLMAAAIAALPVLASGNAGQDAMVMSTESFLAQHPDLRYRREGLRAYRGQKPTEAMTHFRRAARFADKPSQGMVAEMLWKGDGVPRDPVLAYVWMDLAAERGYAVMVARREVFWAGLDDGQRQQAIAAGQAVYAEFGDAVAQPRLERLLRSERKRVTGSRTGFVGNVQIVIPSPSGDVTIDASHYYQDQFWKPAEYWRWQDRDWKDLPQGTVDIGPLQPATPPPPKR